MAFELYKGKGGRSSKPIVTITSAGQIGLSKACFDKHFRNDKDYAQLYYDRGRNIIGIKAVEKEGDYTFKITRSADRASGSIAGRSFLKRLEIDYAKYRKFTPDWDEKEGMLLIKL